MKLYFIFIKNIRSFYIKKIIFQRDLSIGRLNDPGSLGTGNNNIYKVVKRSFLNPCFFLCVLINVYMDFKQFMSTF